MMHLTYVADTLTFMKAQSAAKRNLVLDWEFSKIYVLYLQKAKKKGRTKEEVDQIIEWLFGYSREILQKALSDGVTLEAFVTKGPNPNPKRKLIIGVICGVRVEEIKDTIMQEVRYLDKLIDELAKGRSMDKILRQG